MINFDVFSGSGLGLTQGRGISSAQNTSKNDEKISLNISNGNLVIQSRDEWLLGAGNDIQALRTYNSLGLFDDENQDNFRFGHHRYLKNFNSEIITLVEADGHESTFAWNENEQLYTQVTGSGRLNTLRQNEEHWILERTGEGTQEFYHSIDGVFRLTKMTDSENNWVDFVYNDSGYLNQIFDRASNQAIRYQYDNFNNITQIIATSDGEETSHIYYRYESYGTNNQQRLIEVVVDLTPDDKTVFEDDNRTLNNEVYVTRYQYIDDASLLVSRISQSDGQVIQFNYDTDRRVQGILIGEGEESVKTTFAYGDGFTEVREWLSTSEYHSQMIRFNDHGNPLSISETVSGQKRVVLFQYNNAQQLTTFTNAKGEKTHYQYDKNGNKTLEQNADGITVTYEYDSENRLIAISEYTEKDADLSDLPYLPDGEVNPDFHDNKGQARTTHFVYDDSDRLRFSIFADGSVKESRYEGGASQRVIKHLNYVGDSTRFVGFSERPSLVEMEDWAASLDLSQSQLQEIHLDFRGQIKETIEYDTLSANGEGTGVAARQFYVYDQRGLLKQTVGAGARDRNDAAFTSHYQYDGLARIVATTSPNQDITRINYHDANSTIITEHANGLRVTQVYNSTGQLVSEISSSDTDTLETNYFYDKRGLLIASQDPAGEREHYFHDEQGLTIGVVDSANFLTEFRYDETGNQIASIGYATALSESQRAMLQLRLVTRFAEVNLALDGFRPESTADDRKDYQFYNASGDLQLRVDPAGFVTEFFYDDLGQLIKQIQHANKATINSSLEPIDFADIHWTRDPNSERTQQLEYDSLARVIRRTNGDNRVTEYEYDTAGQLVRQIQLAANPDDNLQHFFLYNNKGQIESQVDSGGFRIDYDYDAAGNLIRTHQFAGRITAESLAALNVDPQTVNRDDLNLEATTQSDRITLSHYDGMNRLISTTDYLGLTTQYVYNSMGQIIQMQRQGDESSRTVEQVYDTFGRLIAEVSATAYEYNQSLGLSATDPNARKVSHQYNDLGQRVRTTDELGRATLYAYDERGLLAFSVDPLGYIEAFQYNAYGELNAEVSYTAALDLSQLAGLPEVTTATLKTLIDKQDTIGFYAQNHLYDERGHIRAQNDSFHYLTSYIHNAFGELANSARDVRGVSGSNIVLDDYYYNKQGQMLSTWFSNNGQAKSVQFGYDEFGQLTTTVDPRGMVSTNTYDPRGLIVTTGANGRVTSTNQFDAFAQITLSSDGEGQRTLFQYNDSQRSTTVISPEGIKTITELNAFGETKRIYQIDEGIEKLIVSYEYDADGNKVSERDALGRESRFTYDASGQVTQTVINGQVTRYEYNAKGQTESIQVGNGPIRTYSYFEVANEGKPGFRVVRESYAGVTTDTYLDHLGRVAREVIDPKGEALATGFEYDADGYTLAQHEGRLIDGELVVTRTTHYEYDQRQQLIAQSVDVGGETLVTRFQYDAAGNQVAITDSFGVTSYQLYDQRQRLALSVDGRGGLTVFAYDNNDQMVSATSYRDSFDLPSYLQAADLNQSTTLGAVLSLVGASDSAALYQFYDKDQRVAFSVDQSRQVQSYQYNRLGLLTQSNHYRLEATDDEFIGLSTEQFRSFLDTRNILASENYAYDDAGRLRLSRDQAGFVTQMLFDELGREMGSIKYREAVSSEVFAELPISDSFIVDPRLKGIVDEQLTIMGHDDRVHYVLDNGQIVRNHYADSGQLIAITRFHERNALTIESLMNQNSVESRLSFLNSELAHSDIAQSQNHFVLDGSGREVYRIDSQGQIIENYYDSRNNLIGKRHYEVEFQGTMPLKGQLSDLANRLQDRLHSPLFEQAMDEITVLGDWQVKASRQDFYFYDNLDRLTLHIDAESYVTAYDYNSGDQLLSQSRSISGVSLAKHAALSQVNLETLQTQALAILESDNIKQARFAYDSAGQVFLELDAAGFLTEYRYDVWGNTIATINYQEPLADALTNEFDFALFAETFNQHDHVNANETNAVFDALNRPIIRVDGEGVVEVFVYHNRDKRIDTFELEQTIPTDLERSTKNIEAFVNAQTKKRVQQSILDSQGRVRFTIDAENYVTEQRYNVFGHANHVIRYLDKLPSEETLARTESAISHYLNVMAAQMANGDRAESTREIFDAQGLVQFEVDSEGFVSQYFYDAAGDVVRKVSYRQSLYEHAQSLEETGLNDLSTIGYQQIKTWVETLGFESAQQLQTVYDDKQQARYVIDALGFVTEHVFDQLGRVVQTNRHDQPIDELLNTIEPDERASHLLANGITTSSQQQVTHFQYDDLDRLIAEIDALGHRTRWLYDSQGNIVREIKEQIDSPLVEQAIIFTDESVNPVTQSSQDRAGRVSLLNDGREIRLQGNAYQYLETDYTIDKDTFIEFEFKASEEAEIQGIAFLGENEDNDWYQNTIKLFGSQDVPGEYDPQIQRYELGGGWQRYRIALGHVKNGQFLGLNKKIVFVSDSDRPQGNRYPGDSSFRDVNLYKNNVVDFSSTPIISVSQDNQDSASGNTTLVADNMLRIEGNSWKRITLPHLIDENTILEFEFKATEQAEIHTLLFTKEPDYKKEFAHIRLWGTQFADALSHDRYNGEGEWQQFRINLADYIKDYGKANYLYLIQDSDAAGNPGVSFLKNLSIYQEAPQDPQETVVNFKESPLISETASNQDNYKLGDIEVVDESTVKMRNNTWKWLELDYNVNENTVIEFEFKGVDEAEIQGLSLGNAYGDRFFTVKTWGTQSDYDTNIEKFEPGYLYPGQWQGYQIRIGSFIENFEAMSRLFFIQDSDASPYPGEAYFRNIRIFDDLSSNQSEGKRDKKAITFDSTLKSYQFNNWQNSSGTMQVSDDGNELALTGNTWKKIAINYEASENTYIEFDFYSDDVAEIHGLILSKDGRYSDPHMIKVAGNQNVVDAYEGDWPTYTEGQWQRYSVRVADINNGSLLGQLDSLFLLLDNDERSVVGESRFANIRFVEKGPEARQSHALYNDRGQLALAIDADGYAKAYEYDYYGNVTKVISYEKRQKQLLALTSPIELEQAQAAIMTSREDRTVESIYNDRQQLVAHRDAAGYVTAYEYDNRGNEVRAIYFEDTFEQLLATESEIASILDLDPNKHNARILNTVYNDLGQAIYLIDESGQVLENQYDAMGNVLQSASYANRLTASQLSVLSEAENGITFIQNELVASDNDRTHVYRYDGLGQLIYEVNPEGALSEFRYDAFGNVIETIQYGQAVDFDESTIDTQIAALASSEQRSTLYLYNDRNELSAEIDALGFVTHYQYEGVSGLLTRKTEFANAIDRTTITSTLTETELLARVSRDSLNDRISEYSYDQDRRLVRETDAEMAAEGKATTYQYDAFDNLIKKTDANGAVWQYQYDGRGHLIKEISPPVTQVVSLSEDMEDYTTMTSAIISSHQYDAFGNRIATTTAQGTNQAYTINYTYDHLGRVETISLPPVDLMQEDGTVLASDRKQINLITDRFGNELVKQSADGQYSYAIFDDKSRLRFELDKAGYLTEYRYNSFGERIQMIRYAKAYQVPEANAGQAIRLTDMTVQAQALADSSQDRSIFFEYDDLGQLVAQHVVTATAADGTTTKNSTTFDYNRYGERTSEYRPGGPEKRFEYNARGELSLELLLASSGESYATEHKYNAFGELSETVEFAAIDSRDRSLSDNRRVSYQYDRRGLLVQTRYHDVDYARLKNAGDIEQVNGDITLQKRYNALGQLISDRAANGAQTLYAYDALGQLVQVQEPTRHLGRGQYATPTTLMRYDSLGNRVITHRLADVNDHIDDTSTITYSQRFNSYGQITQSKEGEGQVTNYYFDLNGNNTHEQIEIEDAFGNTRTRTLTYEYDHLGRQIARASGYFAENTFDFQNTGQFQQQVRQETVRYNAFGEVVAKGVDNEEFEFFEYDQGGRLIRSNQGDGVYRIYDYDHLDQQIAERYEADGALISRREYDAFGRLKKQSHLVATDGSSSAEAYTHFEFNRWGQIEHSTDAYGHGTHYRYDQMGRLTGTSYLFQSKRWSRKGNALVSTTTSEAVETKQYFNQAGYLIGEMDTLGRINTRQVNQVGQVIRINQQEGNFIGKTYDSFGRETSTSRSNLSYTFKRYDKNDNVVEVVTGGVNPNASYFSSDNQFVDLRTGTRKQFAYDALGQRISERDYHLGRGLSVDNFHFDLYAPFADQGYFKSFDEVKYSYDDSGNMIRSWRSENESDSEIMTFDAFGNKRSHKKLDGIMTLWDYQAESSSSQADAYFNRVRKVSYAQGTRGFIHDSIEYEYDERNRLSMETYRVELFINEVTKTHLFYDYYDNNQLKSRTLESAGNQSNWITKHEEYGYDRLGRLTSDKLIIDGVIYKYANVSYDARGNRTSVSYLNGKTGFGSHYTYQYDSENNLIQEQYFSSQSGYFAWDYRYDGNNRIAQIKNHRATGYLTNNRNDAEEYFYYNQEGQLKTQKKVKVHNATFTTSEIQHFEYDFSNRLVRTTAYHETLNSAANQLSTQIKDYESSYHFYDGNRLAQTRKYDGQNKEVYLSKLAYDALGRLSSNAINADGQLTNLKYRYHESSQLVESIDNSTGDITTFTRHVYSPVKGEQKQLSEFAYGGGSASVRRDYDDAGHLVRIDSDTDSDDVSYISDIDGQVVHRVEGLNTTSFDIVENQILGQHSINNYDLIEQPDTTRKYNKSFDVDYEDDFEGFKNHLSRAVGDAKEDFESWLESFRSDAEIDHLLKTIEQEGLGIGIYANDEDTFSYDRYLGVISPSEGKLKIEVDGTRLDTIDIPSFSPSENAGPVELFQYFSSLFDFTYDAFLEHYKSADGNKVAGDNHNPDTYYFRVSYTVPPSKEEWQSGIQIESKVRSYESQRQHDSHHYAVRAGDSLQSIAMAIYGNANLWYVIADANGLNGNAELFAGMRLAIPEVSHFAENSGSSFKPIDQAMMTNAPSTSLYTAYNPTSDAKAVKGNLLKIIAIVLVAVVVALAFAAAAGAVFGMLFAGLGAKAGALAGIGATGMAASAAGTSIGLGTSVALALAGGVVGGLAASAASQGLAIAFGLQESFSWKQFAVDGVFGGIGGGIFGAIGKASMALNFTSRLARIGEMVGYTAIDVGLGVSAAATISAWDSNIPFNWQNVARESAMMSGFFGGLSVIPGGKKPADAGPSVDDISTPTSPAAIAAAEVSTPDVPQAKTRHCFAAGTLIHTERGLVPIENITKADRILTRNDKDLDAPTRYRPILDYFINPHKAVVELTVVDAKGKQETFISTLGHPFYVLGKDWVSASELQVGDKLTSVHRGWIEVTAVAPVEETKTVYNFEIAVDHTYFVGELGVWTHNANCGEDAKADIKKFAGTSVNKFNKVLNGIGKDPSTELENLKSQGPEKSKSKFAGYRMRYKEKLKDEKRGRHGNKSNEQKILTKKYGQKVSGDTHESEHIVGYDVLTGPEKGRGSKTTKENRDIEADGAAYQEVKSAHRKHIGTGNKGKPDGSGFTSESYRRTQKDLLERGDLSSAMQLNQLAYAHNTTFRKSLRMNAKSLNKDLAIEQANDSYEAMVKNVRKRGLVHKKESGVKKRLSLTPQGQLELLVMREQMNTGVFPSQQRIQEIAIKKLGYDWANDHHHESHDIKKHDAEELDAEELDGENDF